jgi:hypothetical protein
MPAILATWEAEIGRVMVQGQSGQTVQKTPISKITRAKWTKGVAEVIESLLCKHEVLSSNLSPTVRRANGRRDLGNGRGTNNRRM